MQWRQCKGRRQKLKPRLNYSAPLSYPLAAFHGQLQEPKANCAGGNEPSAQFFGDAAKLKPVQVVT